MVCQSCHAAIGPDVRFCPKCGAPAVYAPAAPAQTVNPSYVPAYAPPFASPPRVTRHLQTLGILWCVYGLYRIVAGLIGVFFLRAVTAHAFGDQGWPFGGHLPPQFPQAWMGFLLPAVATLTIVSAVLAFITGYGLLNRRPWGRILAIVAAILALLKFPLGTALGIYALWVLAPAASAFEYDSITAQPYRP